MSEGQVATLLLWLVLLAFSLNASLLRTLHANPLYQHLCLGSAIVLVPLWTLRAGLHEGLEIHFLGLTSLTLLLGGRRHCHQRHQTGDPLEQRLIHGHGGAAHCRAGHKANHDFGGVSHLYHPFKGALKWHLASK